VLNFYRLLFPMGKLHPDFNSVEHRAAQAKPGVMTMKALTYDHFGNADALHVSDLPKPVPGKNEVVIAVRATSVNVIDNRVRQGTMGPLVNKKFPKVPGSDVAGVVTEVGADVGDFKVGDAVFGAVDPFKGGAASEYVKVPASQLAMKPKALSFEEAASLPIAGLAALYSLRDLGKVSAGSKVLIHGASGAVGLFAIQIAKASGAHVTAVAGTSGLAAVKDMGADIAIDYKKQDATAFPSTFDVIINASGKFPFSAGKKFLTADGRLIEPSPTIPVFIGSKIANLFRRKKHLVLQTFPKRQDLDHLSKLIETGALRTTIARRFGFAEAAEAFATQEKGGVVGKLIVSMA
jgi:2-desacetyl-2-hydroxyethyl bacteriochlorophyllide A dehydrogenase